MLARLLHSNSLWAGAIVAFVGGMAILAFFLVVPILLVVFGEQLVASPVETLVPFGIVVLLAVVTWAIVHVFRGIDDDMHGEDVEWAETEWESLSVTETTTRRS